MRAGGVVNAHAGAEIVRVGHAVEHQNPCRNGQFLQHFVDALADVADFDPRRDALVPAAAVEPVEPLRRHAHQPHAGALGDRHQVLDA